MDNRETQKIIEIPCDESCMHDALRKIYAALQEKGYNPIDQIVGYILSEDPTYITNHKGARALAQKLDRDALLQIMVQKYISNL